MATESNSAPSKFPTFLTFQEVADRVHVPIGSVRYWVHTRKLPAFKPGKHPLVRESDLLTFIESRHVGQVFEPEAARRKRVGVGTFKAANAARKAAGL